MGYSLDLKKHILSFIEEGRSKIDASKLFHVSQKEKNDRQIRDFVQKNRVSIGYDTFA